MKNILLPTDFSENAYNAIAYASRLFKDEACRFFLLNTYTPVILEPEVLLYSASYPNMEEVYRERSVTGLKKTMERVIKKFGNEKHLFEIISSFNTLNEEISEIVRDEKIDLIVMGTKGATGAKEILFGSNTVHAIKKAVCPLLAVPSGFEFQKLNNILFPSDFEHNFKKNHLELLMELSKTHEARINILKIYLKEALSTEQERNKQILEENFKNIPHTFYNVENESVTEGIFEFRKENGTDMLAMINNKHSFFENLLFKPVINKIGFHVKVPFLVIPSEKRKQ